MSHNILHDVRHAIHKIHQYDVSTSIKGEQLDIELKEANEACNSYRVQVPELRKKRHQYDSALEEATEMKRMSKRNMDHKVVLVSCLEGVAEKLDSELAKQEEDALCYLNATKDDPLSNIIESFNGLKIERETELDHVRQDCIQNKEHIWELDESLRGLESKETIVENMKVQAESRATCYDNVQKSKAEINIKTKENMSSKANMSGEAQFLDDKIEEMQTAHSLIKMDAVNKQDLESQIVKEVSSCEDELAGDLEKFEASENAYNAKLLEVKAIENELPSLQDTLEDLTQKSSELDLTKKQLSELSDQAVYLTEKNNLQKCIEEELIDINDKKLATLNEQTIKEATLEELNIRMNNILSIEKEVEYKEGEIIELETNLNIVSEENDKYVVKLQDMDMTIQEYDASMSNTENSFANLNVEFTDLNKAIEDIEELIKELPHLEEMIRGRKEKLNTIENEIVRLGDHENVVNSEIQEQGSLESARICKEISHYENEINQLLAHQNDLDFKRIQDEESYSMKINALKEQREVEISQAVEISIKNIEEKLRLVQESRLKKIKDEILRHRQLNDDKINSKEVVKRGILTEKKKPNESQDLSEPKMKPIVQNQMDKKAQNSMQVDVSEASDSDSDPFGMADSSESDTENNPSVNRKPPVHSCISKASLAGNSSTIEVKTPASGRLKKVLSTTSKSAEKNFARADPKTPNSGRVKKFLMTPTPKDTSQRSKDTIIQSVTKAGPKDLSQSTKNAISPSATKTPGSSRERKTLQTSRVSSTSLNNSQSAAVPTYNGNTSSGAKTPGKREKKTLITKKA